MHAIYFSVNYQLKHIKMATFQNHRKNTAFFYCNCVNIVDVLYVVILRKKSATHPSSVIFFHQRLWVSCYLFSVVLHSRWWRSHAHWQWALIWFQFWFGLISSFMTEAETQWAVVKGRKWYQKAEISWLDGRGKQSSYYLSPTGMENDSEELTLIFIYEFNSSNCSSNPPLCNSVEKHIKR